MPGNPFYNQSNGARGSGSGVSGDGYDGAQGLFKNVKALAGEIHLLPEFDLNASAKAAAEAFLACKNGAVLPQEAFFHQAEIPRDFPQLSIEDSGAAHVPRMELGHAPNEHGALSSFSKSFSEAGRGIEQLTSGMAEMMQHVLSGPLGIIGSMLGFISELFTSIARGIGDALAEFANIAEAVEQEVWKKDLKL